MVTIAIEDAHNTTLGQSIPYDTSLPTVFKTPIPLNEIILRVRWKPGDVIGTFFMRVDYYNEEGEVKMINYNQWDYPKNQLELFVKHPTDYPDFLCKSIKFEYSGFTQTGKIIFLIIPAKFESDTEKKDYIKKGKKNNNEGIAEYTDVSN